MNHTPHDVNPNGDSPYEHLDDNTDELESCAPIARVPVSEDEAGYVCIVSSRPKPKCSLTSRIGSWFDSIKESPVFLFARTVTVLVLAVTLANWVTTNLSGCSSTTVEASETTDETKNPDETENADEATPPAQEAEASQKGDYTSYQELVNSHPELVFHNFALQSDDNPNNNSNLGENRYREGWGADDYYADWRKVMGDKKEKTDIPVLVAAIATVDAARGSRLCGDFHDGNEYGWKVAMNNTIKDCLYGKLDVSHLKEVFFNLLDNEVRSVELVHVDDVNDQMLMDPYTYSGIPELIVCEKHESGDILLITLRTKGDEENDVVVGFRVQCCYQPVNVADRLGITPTPVPEIPEHTPEPGKGGNTPQPEPGPQPQPEPEYVKDVTQGTVSDPGEGRSPYTNNGDGAQTSSAAVEEQPTSYEEYEERVKETESQVGDSSSTTPSTEAPEDTTVFNDGAEAANDPATDSSFDRPADGSELNADPDAEWSIQE